MVICHNHNIDIDFHAQTHRITTVANSSLIDFILMISMLDENDIVFCRGLVAFRCTCFVFTTAKTMREGKNVSVHEMISR